MVHVTGSTYPETLRHVETLASGAAHHLNNLLAVVLAHLQLAEMKTDCAEVRRHLAAAERAAQDGAHVLHQLSRFGGPHPDEPVPVDLNEIAADALDVAAPGWRRGAARRGRVAVKLDACRIPRVLGDPSLLTEVLLNLVLNALDAMPRGGNLTVRTFAGGARVCCAVSDSGAGMSAHVRERAVAPFFTTKGPRRVGLGLSVSYGIIRGHGGELTLDSVRGRGTTAAFQLPVVETLATTVTAPEQPT